MALLSASAHTGGSPPSTVSTTTSATLSQLSIIRPRLVMPAARKLKKGARSGVHIRIANWLFSFSWHLTAVVCGITVSSWRTALTTLCTASVRWMSASGYSRMSSGAASVLQKACPSCAPSRLNSRAASIPGNRFSTPRSGCRQAWPTQKKDWNHSDRARLSSVTRLTRATAICTTISVWSIRIGRRPCVASAFRNQAALFQIGSTPRRTRSSIFRGSRTTWCTYGPAYWLYILAAPTQTSGNSV